MVPSLRPHIPKAATCRCASMDNSLDGPNLKLSGSALPCGSRISHDDSRFDRIDSSTKHRNSVPGLRRPGVLEDFSDRCRPTLPCLEMDPRATSGEIYYQA